MTLEVTHEYIKDPFISSTYRSYPSYRCFATGRELGRWRWIWRSRWWLALSKLNKISCLEPVNLAGFFMFGHVISYRFLGRVQLNYDSVFFRSSSWLHRYNPVLFFDQFRYKVLRLK